MRVIVLQMKFDLTIAVLIAVTSAATLSLGILHVRAGTLSLGNLLLVVGYLAQLYAPLRTMSRKIQPDAVGARRSGARAWQCSTRCRTWRSVPTARPLARAAGDDRVPQRELRVYRRCARAARRVAADPRRDQRRHRRTHRRRKDHASVAADALLRPDGRRDPARRYRPAGHRADGPAQPVRHRPPGRRPVFDQRGGQHPLREARGHRNERSSRPPAPPTRTISSSRSRRVTRQWSANAGCASPAASGSASLWRARF